MGSRLTLNNTPHQPDPSVPNPMLNTLHRIIAAALTFAAATAVFAITTTTASAAHDTAETTPATTTSAPRNGAAIYLADLPLVDQNGKTVDLYKDFIAGRRIVLHSFFARCEGSCPVMMTILQALQKQLGSRLGKDVHIVSITVDPDHDTPQVLADYARRVQAKSGWHFLSGTSAQVAAALRRIGQYTDAPENHMTLIIVGNDTNGDWRKVHGLAPLKQVVTQIVDALGVEG
jgi:protein SCO1/2